MKNQRSQALSDHAYRLRLVFDRRTQCFVIRFSRIAMFSLILIVIGVKERAMRFEVCTVVVADTIFLKFKF